MLYNQNKSCVKSCKKCLKNPIVFPKNPLFSNMCTFLSHCFKTKNYHWLLEYPRLFVGQLHINIKTFMHKQAIKHKQAIIGGGYLFTENACFNFGCVFLGTNNSTISIYVNLFLCLDCCSKMYIERSGYFVYNSYQPKVRWHNSGFRLICQFRRLWVTPFLWALYFLCNIWYFINSDFKLMLIFYYFCEETVNL